MPTQKFHYIDDIFCCHEVPLETIAEQAGTPSYVYSGDAIRENYRAYDRALAGLEHDIHYAVKANSSLGILSLLGGGRRRVRHCVRRRALPRAEGWRRPFARRIFRRRQGPAKNCATRSNKRSADSTANPTANCGCCGSWRPKSDASPRCRCASIQISTPKRTPTSPPACASTSSASDSRKQSGFTGKRPSCIPCGSTESVATSALRFSTSARLRKRSSGFWNWPAACAASACP